MTFNKLNKLRKNVDKVDEKILKLLSKRLSLSKIIGNYKNINKIKFEDKNRENQIINKLSSDFKNSNLDKLFIKEIYGIIFKKSKKIMSKK